VTDKVLTGDLAVIQRRLNEVLAAKRLGLEGPLTDAEKLEVEEAIVQVFNETVAARQLVERIRSSNIECGRYVNGEVAKFGEGARRQALAFVRKIRGEDRPVTAPAPAAISSTGQPVNITIMPGAFRVELPPSHKRTVDFKRDADGKIVQAEIAGEERRP